MEPFLLASEIDVPVIDCDCMGRALPEIQVIQYKEQTLLDKYSIE